MISPPPFPIFIFNIYFVSSVHFWCQLPVARSCWHSCSVWVDPAVFTRLCYNGWGSDGPEEAGLWVCDSAFPCGFSHNKHRTFRVGTFIQPFWDLLSEDFTACQDTGAGVGGFLHLWNALSGVGRLWSTVIFYVLLLCPCPWAHYQCVPATQASLPSLPHWSTQWGLQLNPSLCYHICRVLGQCRTALGFGSVLPLPVVSLWAQIRPPSGLNAWCLWFLHWMGNPLLNYGCTAWSDFKSRDLEVLSHCHTAPLTPESSILMRWLCGCFQG